MKQWLLAAAFACFSTVAFGQCAVTGPQAIGTPYVASGVDSNCLLTYRQLQGSEIKSPLPYANSGTTAVLGFGQMVLGLDDWTGFTVGQIVQVTYAADPTQYIIGAIVALDTGGGVATINTLVPNPTNVSAAGFQVQVLGGSSLNGVPVWAGLGVDGTDTITNPSAAGNSVSLTVDSGKAFRQNAIVYCWAPEDITTWFEGAVTTYDTGSGALTVFVTLTPNTGLSYSTTFCSLVDTNGPNSALIGYSSSSIGTITTQLKMTVSLPGSITASGSFPSSGSVITFVTQSSQFFPIDGQILANCLTSTTRVAGQVKAYNSGNLILTVTATYNIAGCSAWSLYLDTGPTTRISLYQMNGLQSSGIGTTTLTINAGSIRDSSDTVDLSYSGGTLSLINNSSQVVKVAGPGTISSPASSVTGTSTTFTSTFSTTATLTDLNNQLTALNLSTVSFPSVITAGLATAGTIAIADDTHLTASSSLSVGGGTSYFRGGIKIPDGTTVYGIMLCRKDVDGSIAPFATSFTPNGAPDLPVGYTYFRVIGYVVMTAGAVIGVISQPLVSNVLTTAGDISYFGSGMVNGNTYQEYLQRLPIGSSKQVLNVTSGLPAWGAVDLSSIAVTGILQTANGGTGTSGAVFSRATNVLSGDVSLNNVSNYFDGPSMAQGTSGTWYASGTVTLTDTAGVAAINCELWDGTTVISSTRTRVSAAGGPVSASISGYLASPAGNIRISCQDVTSVSGKILFNASGLSADSSIWGIRIQ